MTTQDKYLLSRLEDLAKASQNRYIYTFSDFLSESEAALAYACRKQHDSPLALVGMQAWGGMEGCERVMLRFGDEDRIGYQATYPICILQIGPQNDKFADTLTHRDFLGALMHLGIERRTLGDILIRENVAWIFAQEKIAPFIAEELTQVRHTSVRCEIVAEVPMQSRPRRQAWFVNIPSVRLDALVARIYHLPRGKARELFAAKQVFVNGMTVTSESMQPKEGDAVSVRGYGKFVYTGLEGETKKGRMVADIEVYG